MWNWIVRHVVDIGHEIGHEVIWFIIALVFCVVAYPVARIGWHARTFARLKRQGYHGEQLKRSQRYAVMGAAIVAVIVATLKFTAPPALWLLFALACAVVAVVGWFGYIFVPEEFEE